MDYLQNTSPLFLDETITINRKSNEFTVDEQLPKSSFPLDHLT